MIANSQYYPKMTVEEYLDWEAKQEHRHEYIDGEIVAMTVGTLYHNDIALNFYRALYPHLRQRGCRVNVSDAKVQANKNSRYFYPDLVISCHPDDLKFREFIQILKLLLKFFLLVQQVTIARKNLNIIVRFRVYKNMS